LDCKFGNLFDSTNDKTKMFEICTIFLKDLKFLYEFKVIPVMISKWCLQQIQIQYINDMKKNR
jgi:hypothetical protein